MPNRRNLVLGAAAGLTIVAAALLAERERRWRAAAAARWSVPPTRPPGVPISQFSRTSTAEDVTLGMDLRGRTVLVTGVTSGIGLETMRVLASRGARILGTGRSLERARQTCASTPGIVTPLELNLDDYASVVRCADAVLREATQLDVIICNAGVMGLKALEQVAGIERHFAVNHLGHYLLVRRLLGRLARAPQGRVVVLSSGAMTWADPAGIEWDNLSGERGYDPNKAYGQSKLANALFSLELARQQQGGAVTSNSLHPGYVDTNLFRHFPLSLRGYRGLLTNKVPVGQGAATSCYLATAPALSMTTGHYFTHCNPELPDARARDGAAAERLWKESERLVADYLD
jgi:NAD(P)-dependent dehydrogenase (short-subunit alcohol dehydrogenase family)